MDNVYHRTAAFINLDAIVHNVREMRKVVRKRTRLMAIVKADAYGHGAVSVAKRLDSEDRAGKILIDAYGVAIVEEGIALRAAGISKPILLLGFIPDEQLLDVARYGLTQTIYNFEKAKKFSDICSEIGKTGEIHIKLDTGMGRLGFRPGDEAFDIISQISKLPWIKITGIFSHLARADEADKSNAEAQFKLFSDFTKRLDDAGIVIPIKHISNSAAAMECPEMNLDMVRLGIVTYGLYPSNEMLRGRIDLQPALEWKTHVSFVKSVAKGTSISYGGIFTADKEMKVATVPVGYADGYPRTLSNKGRVLIHGQSARILGRICMDQFMVDVTDIPDVEIGDTVTLVGRDGNAFIPIEEPADMSGSFNYEFLCCIGGRVPRIERKINE